MKIKNNIKTLFSFGTALGFFIAGFWLNKYIVEPQYSYTLFAILKTISLSISVLSFFIFVFFLNKTINKKAWVNIVFSLFTILTIFIFFELAFTFKTNSTNVYTDLSNQIWMKRYFHPINNLGYRDIEPTEDSKKDNILIVGDSFVAGHGIKTEEMFSNLMKDAIGSDYNIYNLGVCGSHTEREFDSLKNYPIDPDIIILSYYHNDIESAMINYKFSPNIKNPKDNLSNLSKLIIDRSFLLNFVFTNYAKKSISKQFMESPKNDLTAYLHENLWNYQANELDKFKDYAEEKNAELFIVFFPAMGEGITFSHELAGIKLEEYCKDREISYLDLYPHIIDIPQNLRVANPLDHHPSADINVVISDLLIEEIKK